MDVCKATFSVLRRWLNAMWSLALENLALRHQIAVLERSGKRPKLRRRDRAFWILLSVVWPDWCSALVIIKPETVMRWRREHSWLPSCWRSQSRKPGRPAIRKEIRELIRRMSEENLTWGAPRIQSELTLLGYRVAERTVAKYMKRPPASPTQTWRTFLNNHSIEMADIEILNACHSGLHQFYRFIILQYDGRLMSRIGSVLSDWADDLRSREAPAAVLGARRRARTRSVWHCYEAERIEVYSVELSEPRHESLRFNPARFHERGPPRQASGILTSIAVDIHGVNARAA